MRYLTKSRFKLALECPTKLFYTKKEKEYANISNEDSFLQSLAEGGFQVGELAKFYFHDNPIKEKITIETRDEEKAIAETNKMLSRVGRVVIAEAAFRYKNLFVRVDILVRDNDKISIYEVKAKSWDIQKGSFFDKKKRKIKSNWSPYLYDIAFQKYVVSNSLQKGNIKANLTLVNKSKTTDLNGLNQFFTIEKIEGNTVVNVKDGLQRSHLIKEKLLIDINVDEECFKIQNEFSVKTDLGTEIIFTDFVQRCSDIYEKNIRTQVNIGNKCKQCQFRNTKNTELKSGFNECWLSQTNLSEIQIKKENYLLRFGVEELVVGHCLVNLLKKIFIY